MMTACSLIVPVCADAEGQLKGRDGRSWPFAGIVEAHPDPYQPPGCAGVAAVITCMSRYYCIMARARSVSWLHMYADVWQEEDLCCIDLPGVLVHPQLSFMHTPVACLVCCCKLIISTVLLSLYSSSRMQETPSMTPVGSRGHIISCTSAPSSYHTLVQPQ